MILAFAPIDKWPEGWSRELPARENPRFTGTYSSTLDLLDRELTFLRATDVALLVDADHSGVRRDGQLAANAKVRYHGVILRFSTPKFGVLTYTCNTFGNGSEWTGGNYRTLPAWQMNLRAIALGLEALRKVERYGIAERGQQYAGFAQIGTGTAMGRTLDHAMTEAEAWMVLREGAESEHPDADVLYKRAARKHHPDAGGNPETFRKITEARDLLLGNGR